jgi:hypothetical protein
MHFAQRIFLVPATADARSAMNMIEQSTSEIADAVTDGASVGFVVPRRCLSSGVRGRGARSIMALAVCLAVGSCSSSRATSPSRRATPSISSPTPAQGLLAVNSIAIIGHSGATGYNTDPHDPSRDATENSWATGTNPAVDSIYLRLLARNPAIRGHNVNLARDGADVEDLLRQARLLVTEKPLPDLRRHPRPGPHHHRHRRSGRPYPDR